MKNTILYKTLCKAVRKQDRAELLRMLNMIDREKVAFVDCERLGSAFTWAKTPQGWDYWAELNKRLWEAGHYCY